MNIENFDTITGNSTPERIPTVLQVLPALGGSGGVERGTVEIAAAITKAGGRALVASSGGRLEHELKRASAEHITLPMASKNPFVMRSNVERLRALIEQEGIDIVHARSRAPAWSAMAATKQTKARFITTFHGTYGHSNWMKRRYNAVMTQGEKVIAISNFIAGHIRQVYGVPTNQIRIIHRGVDLSRFDPAKVSPERVADLAERWRLPDGVPVVMLPGRLTRWKGQTLFIEAIAKMKTKDIRCVLVGSDQGRLSYRRELEGLIEKYDLGGIVRIVDHCSDMAAAYMMTDVVVSASTDPEAFGRVVIEAQAMGRPVAGAGHGGVRETIINKETGWLVPPGDSGALAVAIDHILEIKGVAREILAAKAIQNVRNNFSKETMCAKTLAVYDEILASNANGI